MKVIQFESVGGASGDLILSALIDLGIDAHELEGELQALGVGHFHLHTEAAASHGLRGTRATVEIHEHDHGHHGRNLRDIEALITASSLPDAVKKTSISVFRRIGETEARMHGTTIDQIHFHEVGAVDSIVDIVGSCLALHKLGSPGVAVGPLPQGRGTIKCEHGVYPNPAPATVDLLKGMPIVQTEEPFELVTPTGAALLSAWKTCDAPSPGSRPLRAGHGFGHHVLNGRPNLLRAVLYDSSDLTDPSDSCLVLECNVDDATPELIGALAERALQAGALDVFTTAVQMKKQRPGMLLTVLCRSEDREKLLDLIFRESTTFGVREYLARRTVLERRWESIATPWGPIRIKIGRWRGEDVTFAPEMEDCLQASRQHNVPVRQVYEQAASAAQSLRGASPPR